MAWRLKVSVGAMGIVLAGLAPLPAIAAGDGLPVDGVDAGPTGVASKLGNVRYVTVPTSAGTVVAAVRRDGGQIVRSTALRGNYTIPAVGLDGSASGLSADGRTLVLITPRPSFPRNRTPLVVLDARRLQQRDRIDMRGDFSFDAVSPDGRRAYLIHYTSRRDFTRYEVRALDLRTGRLLPKPIVDPAEEPGGMRGLPITRATSPDGRWAYTLYDGAGKHPFVHALDTVRSQAKCIDLDALAGRRDLYGLKLAARPDGAALDVVSGAKSTLARIDLASFTVGTPTQAADRGVPAGVLAGAAILLVLAGLTYVLRRRVTNLPSEGGRTVEGS